MRTLLFAIFGFIILGLCTPFVAHAQSGSYPPSYTYPNVESSVPQNQHTFVQSVTIEVLSSLICQISGINVINRQQGCLGVNTTTGKLSYADPTQIPQYGGLLGMSANMIGMLYTPSASGVQYVKHLASNFGIAKSANAQLNPGPDCDPLSGGPCVQYNRSTGFDSLFPVQRLWLSIRNITFIFFVLIFVVIGIGIMLRIKIDPRTVMTLQNQLPKVVVSLVLISFSYALVGFFIDLMWVSTYVGVNILTGAHQQQGQTITDDDPNSLKGKAYNNILNFPVAFMNDMFVKNECLSDADGREDSGTSCSGLINLSGQVGDSLGQVISQAVTQIVGAPAGTSCSPGSVLPGGSDFDIRKCVADVFGFIAGLLGILIAFIAVIVVLLRLWWSMLKAYAYIIIYTISAPLWIMFGLIPGSSLGFTRWIRTIIANLMIFPAAAFLIIGARIIMDLYGGGYTETRDPSIPLQPFVAPLVGNPGLEGFGALLAFGMLLLAPELLNTIRDGMKAPGSKLGDTVKAGFGVGMAGALMAPKAVWNRSTALGGHGVESGIIRRKLAGVGTPKYTYQKIFRSLGMQAGLNKDVYHASNVGPLKGD